MRYISFLLTAFLTLTVFAARADVKDTTVGVCLIGVTGTADVPAAAMAQRYGLSTTIGINFFYKTRSNWLIGAEYNYLFGNKVKEKTLGNLLTSEGSIINGSGQFQAVRINERGQIPMIKIGKVFPVIGPNPNSGIIAMLGAGVMEHKVKYYFPSNNPPPQMAGVYYKGYDRLTNGLALSQSIGLLYLGNSRRVNFSASFEAIEGFTRGRRDFQYDLMKKDDTKRLDILLGLRFTWHLPVYGKNRGGYYY